jgi:hypothetical protein
VLGVSGVQWVALEVLEVQKEEMGVKLEEDWVVFDYDIQQGYQAYLERNRVNRQSKGNDPI